MRRLSRRLLPAMLLGALAAGVPAALAAGLRTRVGLEPSEVYLGSPATLRVEVEEPAGVEVDLPALTKALSDLPGVKPRPVERKPLPAGGRRLVVEASLVSFELGAPSGVLARVPWKGSQGGGELALWLPSPRVVPVPHKAGDQEGVLRSARGVVDPAPPGFPWLLPALGLLLLGLSFLLRRRQGEEAPPPGTLEAPYDRALRLLAELEALGDGGDPRSFHYRLSEILRDYLSRRYQVPGLSETTDELTVELQTAGVDPEVLDRARDLMRSMDLVKFGPDEAAPGDSPGNLRRSLELVEQTAPAVNAPESRGGPS